MNKYEVTRRLYMTKDGRLVPEAHVDGEYLYAKAGDLLPMDEARGFGLVKDAPAPKQSKSKPKASDEG